MGWVDSLGMGRERMQVGVKLKIYGRVQGVFYRQSTRAKAQELGLSGWVRNLPDGTVEAQAFGEQEVVNEFVDWCRNGPPHASVERIEVEELSDKTTSTGVTSINVSGQFEVR